ncbi:MAG TPA: L-erythro-3,5-diaminohexanoate dehydrogenase [Streptosporangiaceae bacterium]
MEHPLIQDPPRTARRPGSPLGLHRVLEPSGVLPQAAWRLDADPAIWPNEVRITVDRLNLDAASYRQLRESTGGSVGAMRGAVLDIIAGRGKMQNPVTGSGGMLTGVVDEAGPASPLGLAAGDRIATLVSLSLTPLAVTDGLARWDGRSEQVPCAGHAILFGRSIAAVLPADLPAGLALAVLDVCGAPALTERVVRAELAGAGLARAGAARDESAGAGPAGAGPAGAGHGGPVVAILGAGGKSGSLSAAAARRAGAGTIIGVVPAEAEAAALRQAGVADQVVIADARDPVALAGAVRSAGGPAAVTVVCVDVPGCEGGAILATAPGGTVIFFSMATSFSAAALGAEGVAADVTMLVGNGYVPGHAELALDLIRSEPGVRGLFEARLAEPG